MTTIVYANGVLAGDSRATSTGDMKRHCLKCGEAMHYTIDEPTKNLGHKVQANFSPGFSYHGAPVRAIARSGHIGASDHAIQMLKKGKDIDQIYHTFVEFGRKVIPDQETFALVIITTEKLWLFHFSAKSSSLTIKEHSLQESFAHGSGGQAARMLMKLCPQAPAVEVLKAVMREDEYTGGAVVWVDTGSETAEVTQTPVTPDDLQVILPRMCGLIWQARDRELKQEKRNQRITKTAGRQPARRKVNTQD